MVRDRISPKTRNRFKRAIRDVVSGLSRKIKVYKQPIKVDCPNCYYDKLTASSTGKCRWTLSEAIQKQQDYELTNPGVIRYKWFSVGRCPICKGLGFLETKRKVWIDCLVIWDPESRSGNDVTYTPAGTEGSTSLQLKTHPKHYDLFKNCSKIVVDNIDCKLSKPPVTRGLGNEAVLIISAFTTEKLKVDRSEIIKDYN